MLKRILENAFIRFVEMLVSLLIIMLILAVLIVIVVICDKGFMLLGLLLFPLVIFLANLILTIIDEISRKDDKNER